MSTDYNATVRTVVSGEGWMGAGVGSIQTAMEELVRSARVELLVLAYAVSDGAGELLDLVEDRLRAGVRVTMVVDRLSGQYGAVPGRLESLAQQYAGYCRIHDFSGAEEGAHLHAKLVAADRRKALVGSANLSWHGLVGNHELAVLVEGPAVGELVSAAQRLLADPRLRQIGIP